MSRLSAAASIVALVIASPAVADVSAVTLSSGGLAEVTSEHQVAGDGSVRLDVPADQIDDVLKSLLVRDAEGKVGDVSLDGPSQAQETFKQLPFTAEDLASPPRLLAALQGVDVTIRTDDRSISGKSLGVTERNAGDAGVEQVAAVLAEGGEIQTIAVRTGTNVSVQDPSMLERIRNAAAVAGRSRAAGLKQVDIRLTGGGDRKVAISYVVAAPVWKAAYRVIYRGDGKGRLQAWAVIENATGEDWKDVAVTLSSGAPVTLKQRLGQRYWRERPEVPVDVEGARVPDTDPGVMAARPAGRQAALQKSAAPPAPAGAMLESRLDDGALGYGGPPPVAEAARSAEATENAISAIYRLPLPITLAAGRTLSAPLVDSDVSIERVSLFKPGMGAKPVAALSIKNETQASLPPGIVTVYDAAAGYVGDARLPSMPAGDVRMASFATDRKVTVATETKPEQIVGGIVVRDGVASVSLTLRETTVYTIKGAPDGDRTVVIEQPKRDGWTLTSEALSGETATDHRLKVKTPANGTTTVTATQEQVRLDAFELADADEGQVSLWSSSTTDKALSAKLDALSKARAAVASLERQIEEQDGVALRTKTEQDRTRSNLGAVPRESELARRYLRQMADQEDKIAAASQQRDAFDAERKIAQAKVDEAIRAF